jgi:hypothetical protein
MGIPVFSEIEKLITEHGSAVILRERLAFLKDQFDALEKEAKQLRDDNKTLKSTLAAAVRQKEPAKVDLTLAKKYFTHFHPSGPVLRFLREQDMAAPFRKESAEPLFIYTDTWKGPNFEFLDEDIEEARREFDVLVRKFTHELAMKTTPDRHGFVSMGFKDMEDRDYMWADQKILNDFSSESAKAFDAFYKIARVRFPNEEIA